MTLEKNEPPDWAAAGLDYVGGDRPRVRPHDPFSIDPIDAADFPPEVKAVLDELAKAAKAGKVGPSPGPLTGEPIVPPLHPMCKSVITAGEELAEVKLEGESVLQSAAKKSFAELRSDLFDVQKDLLELRSHYRHNLVRVFAAGVLIAWGLWRLFGGP